jgi:pimeloyl-ACP methyl ester carboxylesterase
MMIVNRRGAWVVLLCGVVGLLAVWPTRAQPPGAQPDGASIPRFEPAPCPVQPPAGANVSCGYLVVREDRTKPDGRLIRVAVGIARATSPTPRPDPVVYLHGGPGMSVVRRVRWWPYASFRRERDVIVIDQRGAGLSQPGLDCPELRDVPVVTLLGGVRQGFTETNHAALALACHARLSSQGIDLTQYTNAASAADLDDLRKVLRYDQWNLFAWSAGTRLALAILRDYPAGVRSAILDSVYMPPSVDYYAELVPNAAKTLQTVFAACAAEPTCEQSYPALEALLLDTVDRLNAQPLAFKVAHPFTGEMIDARMNGPAFVGLLYRLLYENFNIGLVPKLIADVRRGDARALPALLREPLAEPSLYRVGMNHTIHCMEAAPFTTRDEIDAAWNTVDARYFGFYHWDVNPQAFMTFCGQWRGAAQPDPRDAEAVRSDIPTLILAGTFDPASPPAHGKLAAQTLAASFYIEFPTMGHFAWEYGGACPQRIALAFLDNPAQRPPEDCVAQMPRVKFLHEGQIVALPGLYRLADSILSEGYSARNVGPLLGILAILGLVPLITLAGEVAVRRRRRNTPSQPSPTSRVFGLRLAHVFAWLIMMLNAVAAGVLGSNILGTLNNNPGMVNFGLPAALTPFLLIPLIAGGLATGLLALVGMAWAGRRWPIAARIGYLLVALGAFGLLAWMAAWGVLPVISL